MSDTIDLQCEIFSLELLIDEATQAGEINSARELMTRWYRLTLDSYDSISLIRLFNVHLLLWRTSIEQADAVAINEFSTRLTLLGNRIEELNA